SLSGDTDTSGARTLSSSTAIGGCYTGQYLRHEGYLLSPAEAKEMLDDDRRNREVIWPFVIGRDMLTDGRPSRWAIDFQGRSIVEAQSYTMPFSHLRAQVLPD